MLTCQTRNWYPPCGDVRYTVELSEVTSTFISLENDFNSGESPYTTALSRFMCRIISASDLLPLTILEFQSASTPEWMLLRTCEWSVLGELSGFKTAQ